MKNMLFQINFLTFWEFRIQEVGYFRAPQND
jgi:hypothetical protein